MPTAAVVVRRLGRADIHVLRKLNVLFGEAFDDPDTYGEQPPCEAYLKGLLAKEHVVVVAALTGAEVVGGLVAYELDKFERARREYYIYDIAVHTRYRRQRIATALIEYLCEIAARRGGWVVFVQADRADGGAIALYERLGAREEVLHFDISVKPSP